MQQILAQIIIEIIEIIILYKIEKIFSKFF